MSKLKSDGLHTVTLLRDHEHDGKQCRASEKIQVTTPVKNWLMAQHVIAPDAETKTDITGSDE